MYLVVNADDFGRCTAINQAVARAWADGILTSASLMVTGDAAPQAVELAGQHPHRAVGLHLTLTELPPALGPDRAANLVDRSTGRFPSSPAAMGWRLFRSKAARRELAAEMAAQFQLFEQTGLPLSHVDGHQHLHVHPVVLDLLLPLADRYGATGVRLPREPLPRQRDGWSTAARQRTYSIVFACLCASAAAKLRHFPNLFLPDHSFGLMYSGEMNQTHVLSLLNHLPPPGPAQCIEMYFHPTLGPRLDPLGPNPEDLDALMSPIVKDAVARAGLRLATYSQAHRAQAEASAHPPLPPFGRAAVS